MPKDFKSAVSNYLQEIGTEAYQPLSTLLTKLNLCQSSKCAESGLQQPELAATE